MERLLLTVALMLSCGISSALDKSDVIMLSKAGTNKDVIVVVIEQSNFSLTLSAGDVLELKRAGVHDDVIRCMQSRTRKVEVIPAPAPVREEVVVVQSPPPPPPPVVVYQEPVYVVREYPVYRCYTPAPRPTFSFDFIFGGGSHHSSSHHNRHHR